MYSRTTEAERKQEDGWILVEHHLPPTNEMVEVIGRNYKASEVFIGSAKFDPTSGWKGMTKVFAWKTPSSTLRRIQEAYPAKSIL